MKCPKCGYLGFEQVERCRNCGYDFSLTESTVDPGLSIRSDARDTRTLGDLSMIDAAIAGEPLLHPDKGLSDFDRLPDFANPGGASDLPLFRLPESDDEPLIARPSPPRPPLSVRRSTPEIPRLRAEQPRTPSFDLGLDLEFVRPFAAIDGA